MKKTLLLASLLAVILAFCGKHASATDANPYVELQLSVYAAKKQTLIGKQLYMEKEASAKDVSFYGEAYSDQDFSSLYGGVTKKLGNFQAAVGGGQAWFDGTYHPMLNTWLFYSNDDVEGLLFVDRYFRTDRSSRFFSKGRLQTDIGGNFFAGVYGEKGIGIGPIIGRKFGKSVKASLFVPVAKQPSEGEDRTKVVLMVSIEF